MGRYELILRTSFDASHQLRMPDGTMEPLHGHDWRVEVYLEGGPLDEAGIVADFTALQRGLSQITAELRNRRLNELAAFAGRNPSTELIAKYICDSFSPTLPPNVRVTKTLLWETEECAAAYIPGPSP